MTFEGDNAFIGAATDAPPAIIALIRFDLKVGPVTTWTWPPGFTACLESEDQSAIHKQSESEKRGDQYIEARENAPPSHRDRETHAKQWQPSKELQRAIIDQLPSYCLPEGASSRQTQQKSVTSPLNSSTATAVEPQIKHEARFLLPVRRRATTRRSKLNEGSQIGEAKEEVLFGCSVYVVVSEPGGEKEKAVSYAKRGAAQFAVAVLSTSPAMELLLQRLRSVVPVFVRAQFSSFSFYDDDNRHGGDSLSASQASIAWVGAVTLAGASVLRGVFYSLVEDHSIGEGANKEVNDPNVFRRLKAWCSSSVESALLPIGRHLAVGQHIADLGASVPAVEVLGRRIRALLWPLIKLILLEGRVLFYSRNAARASAAVVSISGALQLHLQIDFVTNLSVSEFFLIAMYNSLPTKTSGPWLRCFQALLRLDWGTPRPPRRFPPFDGGVLDCL